MFSDGCTSFSFPDAQSRLFFSYFTFSAIILHQFLRYLMRVGSLRRESQCVLVHFRQKNIYVSKLLFHQFFHLKDLHGWTVPGQKCLSQRRLFRFFLRRIRHVCVWGRAGCRHVRLGESLGEPFVCKWIVFVFGQAAPRHPYLSGLVWNPLGAQRN